MSLARPKAARLFAAVLAAGLILTGCAESDRDDDESSGDSETFVFGAPGDPASLDPALASDGETFRVTRQAFEALLEHDGTELVGGLAETWEQNEAGTEWTFHLRDGVTFHDGGELTGEAVCKNYDYWYNLTGTYQNPALTYYWQAIMGGFAENESEDAPEPNYVGCTAPDPLTAVIEVAEPSANLPGGFSLQALAIHSPKSIDAHQEQQASGEGENINYPEYSQVPSDDLAGTGPFRITEWNKGNGEVTLERFDEYWGETKAGVDQLVFRTLSEENARLQALQAGNIDGYDLVAPGDVQTLEDGGFQVPVRDVFNIFYLGFTQEANPALEDERVRRAIAHALDRQTLVDTQLPEGGVVASQFIPDTVEGYSDNVTTYAYDPDEARDLLADAGQENLTLEFCYPTEVSRPYMPAPEDMYEVLRADLEAVGITVEPNPMVWNPTYLDTAETGGCEMRLMGWTGDFNDAFNFLGTWFNGYSEEWGFRNEELFELMNEAETEGDVEARVGLYQEINDMVMDYLPGVPISSSPPSIAFAEDVNPPTVSPLTQENFAEVSFK